MRERLKTVGDIRLDHPPLALPRLVDENLQGVVRRASGAKPERARVKVGLEDRLEHDPRGGLHDAVADRRDRQRPSLAAAGLRDEHPARGQRAVGAVLEVSAREPRSRASTRST
jgi:hypothetical protein